MQRLLATESYFLTHGGVCWVLQLHACHACLDTSQGSQAAHDTCCKQTR